MRDRRLIGRPMPDKSQADIAYGFVGLARRDPDYYAALVMNNALGQYALGGRLGDSIRERQGMAYYVFSNLEAGRAAGPLMVRAGVVECQRRADHRLDRRGAAPGADRGLHRAPRSTTPSSISPGRCRASSKPTPASPASCCRPSCTAWAATTTGGLPGLIRAVTHDDVARVAARLLDPARAVVAVAGPWTVELA